MCIFFIYINERENLQYYIIWHIVLIQVQMPFKPHPVEEDNGFSEPSTQREFSDTTSPSALYFYDASL